MLPSTDDLPDIELKIFNSGWVAAHKGMVLAGAGREKMRMPALFAMIRHPKHGVILYDTGYSTRFYDVTGRFPFSMLRKFTPAEITEEDNAVRQLEAAGVPADQVKTIILGHGHVDHVPGVADFPEAKVVVDHREWAFMQGSTLGIFFKGYVKSLYENIGNQIETLNFATQGKPYGLFDKAIDIWEDGSMILVPIEGHTVGQMGLLVNLPDGKRFFFIGDAAWISENYLYIKPPSLIARTILASFRKFKETLQLIKSFHEENPDVTIVPSHCPAVWEKLKSTEVAS